MNTILYISYDGLTDTLGQSQIIPYLKGLSGKGYKITIISCEKKNKYKSHKNNIKNVLEKNNIIWHPLLYTKNPPILSTLIDIYKIKRKTISLHKKENFSIIHCRSYIASIVGLWMKKNYGTKFIFDMRGFWADERVDGGLWNLTNPLFKIIYNFFKKKEFEFLTNADYTISLTKKAKQIILHTPLSFGGEKGVRHLAPIEVIPCCADTEHFSRKRLDKNKIDLLRKMLNINADDFVLSYLGSIGTWYMLDEMLDFFSCLLKSKTNSKFLLITSEKKEIILNATKKKNISIDNIIIQKAAYSEVPEYLSLGTISIFFIKPCFSKNASSPTKQAEVLSMGIPIICNSGIGDTDEIIRNNNCGIVIDNFTIEEYNKAISEIDNCMKIPPENIRNIAIKHFSLEKGVELYGNVYKTLLERN